MVAYGRGAISFVLILGLMCVAGPPATASEPSGVLVVEPLPRGAKCPDVEKVRAWWRAAQEAHLRGDSAEAVRQSLVAYQTFPRASTAARVGAYKERAGNHVEAFEWYLTARNYHPRSKLMARLVTALRRTGDKAGFGVVRVKTAPGGGVVDIDGAATAKGGVWFGLSAREHVVSADTPLKSWASQRVRVAAGSIQTISVRAPVAQALRVQRSLAPEQASIAVPVGLILGGVVAAGLGGGLQVWGSDLDAEASGQSKLAARPGPVPDGADQRLAAGIFMGVGGAAILAGLIVWARQDAAEPGEGAGLTLSPTMVPQGGGLTFGGQF